MRELLRSERGIALPLAAGVLLTLSLLVVAVVNNSMQSTNSANKDRNVKRALAAAEAGLQTASNRLNLLPNPDAGACLTDAWVRVPGECPGHTMDIGNDARFTYWVTPDLTAGRDCASGPTCAERIITSVGEVKGELRRLQTRVEAQPPHLPYFPVRGVFGDTGVEFMNRADVEGSVGSNGRISAHVQSTAELLEPPVGIPPAWRGRPVPPIAEHGGISLPRVPIEGTEDENSNLLIATNGRIHYDPDTRALDAEGLLVLPPGDYNFCRFSSHNNLRIEVLGPVRIFIDNASRPGSGCRHRGGDWGTFQTHNNAIINPHPSPVVNFQLFVYGGGDVRFHNHAEFNGSIFAPQSLVRFHNNASVTGAISGEYVDFHNAAHFLYHDGFTESGSGQGEYERERWVECRPRATTPGDPESGC